jgi:hypothetical protein
MYTIIIVMIIFIIIFLISEFKTENPTIIGCIIGGIFIGFCLGSLVRLSLPMDLKETTVSYDIKPIDEKHSIIYDKTYNVYVVQIIDKKSGIITYEQYNEIYVRFKYNNNYKVSVINYTPTDSWINKFAYDFKCNDIKEIIIEVPDESISLK